LEETLISVLDDFTPDTGVFRALWSSGRTNSTKIKVFIDFLTVSFSSDIFQLKSLGRYDRAGSRGTVFPLGLPSSVASDEVA
jgi:hypothetical protein